MKTTRISAPGVLTAIGLLAVTTGCSSRSRLPVYDPSQVGTVMSTEKGEVVSVRDVLIKPQPPAGSSTGAIIGAGVGQTAATGSPGAIGGAVCVATDNGVFAQSGQRVDRRPLVGARSFEIQSLQFKGRWY